MTDGMMDIGSMSMESASQSGGRNVRQKKPAVQAIDFKLLIAVGVIALILIVVAAVAIAGAAGRSKAKKAVVRFGEILSLGTDINKNDVLDYYEKCYPQEYYDVVEEEFKDADNESSYMKKYWGKNKGITLEIISVTSIKDSESVDMFLDEVKTVFNKRNVKLKAKDIDVSSAYLVLGRMDLDSKSDVMSFLVLKVNGKYGVYGIGELSVSAL